jgi:hypothetical protein
VPWPPLATDTSPDDFAPHVVHMPKAPGPKPGKVKLSLEMEVVPKAKQPGMVVPMVPVGACNFLCTLVPTDNPPP